MFAIRELNLARRANCSASLPLAFCVELEGRLELTATPGAEAAAAVAFEGGSRGRLVAGSDATVTFPLFELWEVVPWA